MNEILEIFLQTGVPGASVAAMAFVVYRLWSEGNTERARHLADRMEAAHAHRKELDELGKVHIADVKSLYAMRIVDAEAIHKQMLDVVKQCTIVLETTASSLEGHKDATLEHRDAQKEAAEELRKLSTLLVALNDEVKTRLRSPGR